MKRGVALLVLFGLALAQSQDFLQQLLQTLTDTQGVLLGLQGSLERIQQGVLRLVPAVALLALIYGSFKAMAEGFEAIREQLYRLVLVVVLVALSGVIWTGAIGIWNAARVMGGQFIQQQSKQATRDLEALADGIGDFMVASYALNVSSGRSEAISDATQADLSPQATQAAESNLTALVVFSLMLFVLTFFYYFIILGTGFAVTLAGALFPFVAVMLAFPGNSGLLWAGNFFKVFVRSVFIVLLVPIVFGYAFDLGINKPVRELRNLVEAVQVQQVELSREVRGYVDGIVGCNQLCESLFRERRDQLVEQLSGTLSQAAGMLRGIAVVLVVVLAGLLGAWFILRRFERTIAELLGGWASDVSRMVGRAAGMAAGGASVGAVNPSARAATIHHSQGTKAPQGGGP